MFETDRPLHTQVCLLMSISSDTIVTILLQLKWAGKDVEEVRGGLQASTAVVKTVQLTYAAAYASMAYLTGALQKASLDYVSFTQTKSPPTLPHFCITTDPHSQLSGVSLTNSKADEERLAFVLNLEHVRNSNEDEPGAERTSIAIHDDVTGSKDAWCLPLDLVDGEDTDRPPSFDRNEDTSFPGFFTRLTPGSGGVGCVVNSSLLYALFPLFL